MAAVVFGLIGLFAIGLSHAGPASSHDLTQARTAYEEQCSKCHGLVEREAQRPPEPLPGMRIASNDLRFAVALPYGPSLRGIYGRTAGTMPDFNYSQAFQRVLKDVVWNEGTLERWLTDTQKWVQGTRMFYRQPDAMIRRRIIAYLKAQSP
jgi:cytochrome c2